MTYTDLEYADRWISAMRARTKWTAEDMLFHAGMMRRGGYMSASEYAAVEMRLTDETSGLN